MARVDEHGGSKASPRRVSLRRAALESYREIVGDELVAEVREVAEALRGMRVLELSATATGGGVAELLEDPLRAGEIGAAGAVTVRERFLLPRLLRDHLAVLRELVS